MMKNFFERVSQAFPVSDVVLFVMFAFLMDLVLFDRGSWVDSATQVFAIYFPIYIVWGFVLMLMSGRIKIKDAVEQQPNVVSNDAGKQFKEISHNVKLSTEIVGRYMDRDIPAWIEKPDGTRLYFEGTIRKTPMGNWDPNGLVNGANIIEPGLVYRVQKQS